MLAVISERIDFGARAEVRQADRHLPAVRSGWADLHSSAVSRRPHDELVHAYEYYRAGLLFRLAAIAWHAGAAL